MRAVDWTVRLNTSGVVLFASLTTEESVSDAYVLDVPGSAEVVIDIR